MTPRVMHPEQAVLPKAKKSVQCSECAGDGRYQPPAPDFNPAEWDLTCEACNGRGTRTVTIHRSVHLTRDEHDSLLQFLQAEFVRRYWLVLDDPRNARAGHAYQLAEKALAAYYQSDERTRAFQLAAERAWEDKRDRKTTRPRPTALALEVEQRR